KNRCEQRSWFKAFLGATQHFSCCEIYLSVGRLSPSRKHEDGLWVEFAPKTQYFGAQETQCLSRSDRFTFYTQIDVGPASPHAGKAECPYSWPTPLEFLEGWGDARFRHLEHHKGMFYPFHPVVKRGVTVIQRPFHHGPGNHGKPRHESMVTNEKPGNLVVGVGDYVAALREIAHLQAVLVFRQGHIATATPFPLVVGTALSDQTFGFRMQHQLHAQCLGGRLSGTIIGRGANASTTEDDVLGCETAFQYGNDVFLRIRDNLNAAKLHAAFSQQLNEVGHVLVLPSTRENLISDKYEPNLRHVLIHNAAPDKRC